MRLRPHLAALAALEEEDSLGYEEAMPYGGKPGAVRFLEMFTAQQFGGDLASWCAWFADRSPDEINELYVKLEAYSKLLPKRNRISSGDKSDRRSDEDPDTAGVVE